MNTKKVVEHVPNIIERLNKNFIFIKDSRKRFDLFYSVNIPNLDNNFGFICYFSKYDKDSRIPLNFSLLPEMEGKIPEDCYRIFMDIHLNKFTAERNPVLTDNIQSNLDNLLHIGINPTWSENDIRAVLDFVLTELNSL